VSRLSFRTPVIATARVMVGHLRGFFGRDLIEQSAIERLARAVLVAGLLWVAIAWALS
jgi:hypothetical protein